MKTMKDIQNCYSDLVMRVFEQISASSKKNTNLLICRFRNHIFKIKFTKISSER